MSRWQRLRHELLRELHKIYMTSHTTWAEFPPADDATSEDISRELSYLEEKGFVRKDGRLCQLTAEGRDHVEANLQNPSTTPKAKPV